MWFFVFVFWWCRSHKQQSLFKIAMPLFFLVFSSFIFHAFINYIFMPAVSVLEGIFKLLHFCKFLSAHIYILYTIHTHIHTYTVYLHNAFIWSLLFFFFLQQKMCFIAQCYIFLLYALFTFLLFLFSHFYSIFLWNRWLRWL